MDPSPLVPGTLVGLELFIYWEKRPLCRSKQSLVSRSHSVYGPAAERTITGDSFLRCRPLTSRRLRQPLRGHGIPSRVIASPYTGADGASAVSPQRDNRGMTTLESVHRASVCRCGCCGVGGGGGEEQVHHAGRRSPPPSLAELASGETENAVLIASLTAGHRFELLGRSTRSRPARLPSFPAREPGAAPGPPATYVRP